MVYSFYMSSEELPVYLVELLRDARVHSGFIAVIRGDVSSEPSVSPIDSLSVNIVLYIDGGHVYIQSGGVAPRSLRVIDVDMVVRTARLLYGRRARLPVMLRLRGDIGVYITRARVTRRLASSIEAHIMPYIDIDAGEQEEVEVEGVNLVYTLRPGPPIISVRFVKSGSRGISVYSDTPAAFRLRRATLAEILENGRLIITAHNTSFLTECDIDIMKDAAGALLSISTT